MKRFALNDVETFGAGFAATFGAAAFFEAVFFTGTFAFGFAAGLDADFVFDFDFGAFDLAIAMRLYKCGLSLVPSLLSFR